MTMTDYQKYRGKCKEMCEALIKERPDLKLVRGHYWCPMWNSNEAHWWCVDPEGNIVDPSVKQFPSNGLGDYVEFGGDIECAECGKMVPEAEASIEGNYGFCSGRCHGRFVGVL